MQETFTQWHYYKLHEERFVFSLDTNKINENRRMLHLNISQFD